MDSSKFKTGHVHYTYLAFVSINKIKMYLWNITPSAGSSRFKRSGSRYIFHYMIFYQTEKKNPNLSSTTTYTDLLWPLTYVYNLETETGEIIKKRKTYVKWKLPLKAFTMTLERHMQGHITLQIVHQATQKYIMHIYTWCWPYISSFIIIHQKIWGHKNKQTENDLFQ